MTHADPTAAVVILAAGAGRRLGLGPKAHVDLGGKTFLERVVASCRAAGLGPLWVVASADDLRMAEVATRLALQLCWNVDPARGMSSSVHVGLQAASPRSPVLVFPVDLPLVQPATLRGLAAAGLRHPSGWARPCFGDAGGHPVVLGRELASRVRAAGPLAPLRETLAAADVQRFDLDVDDAGVVRDVDDAEDLAAAQVAVTAHESRPD